MVAMRFTSSQFKLIVLCSLGLTAVFAFVQIACFSSVFSGNRSSCGPRTRSTYVRLRPLPVMNMDEGGNGGQLDDEDSEPLPVIYAITPTYARLVQKAELTRLSHTFLLISRFHWIIIEDTYAKTDLVSNFVTRTLGLARSLNSDLKITHLNVPTPENYKARSSDPNWLKPRGVLQRNAGITWLRENRDSLPRSSPSRDPDAMATGVIYFCDDDNTYDVKIFEEMRSTKRVSVWPVGLVGGLKVEKPYVEGGQVVGWNTQWKPERPYPVDMAGFAVNLKLFLKRAEARFSYKIPRGFQESHIISLLIDGPDELEPRADNCTKVLVWHTRTENPKLNQELRLKVPSNHGMEL